MRFAHLDFYSLFLVRVEQQLRQSSATPDQFAHALDINKSQLGLWLDRAVREGRLTKLNKPVRYVWNPLASDQPGLFYQDSLSDGVIGLRGGCAGALDVSSIENPDERRGQSTGRSFAHHRAGAAGLT